MNRTARIHKKNGAFRAGTLLVLVALTSVSQITTARAADDIADAVGVSANAVARGRGDIGKIIDCHITVEPRKWEGRGDEIATEIAGNDACGRTARAGHNGPGTDRRR